VSSRYRLNNEALRPEFAAALTSAGVTDAYAVVEPMSVITVSMSVLHCAKEGMGIS
jgi:hypothetical protein